MVSAGLSIFSVASTHPTLTVATHTLVAIAAIFAATVPLAAPTTVTATFRSALVSAIPATTQDTTSLSTTVPSTFATPAAESAPANATFATSVSTILIFVGTRA